MSEEPKEQARAARRPRPIPRASGPQGTRSGWIVLAVILAVFLGSRYLSTNQPQPLELSLTEFRQRVERSEIESVERVRVVDGARTYLRGKLLDAPRTAFRVTLVPGENESLMDFLAAKNVRCPVKEEEPLFGPFLQQLLIFGVFAALMWFLIYRKMMGGGAGGMFSFGKSRARLMDENKGAGKVTFKDVAGVDEAKEDVAEVVEFLKDPKKFTKLGARIPRGILLVGPPGTGKTLLAKAIAGEAKVPFYSISGSDFEEMFVGVGASRVRDLFEQGKKNAPCIIFIDEIDSVGQKRNSGGMAAQRCADQTLNAMLVEMDGFGTNDGVVVLAATNRADILDPALLRPSRFDRQIYVGYPDIKGREDVLKIHTANKPLAEDVDLAKVARGTAGFTGADLENLSNEAALLCARRGDQFITMADFEEAEIKVLAGPEKRSRVVPEHERKLTAYHEAGHAVVMHALPTHEPVHRITIVPRGHAGGMTISLPDEDHSYQSKRYMEEQIVSLLGGRAAEKLMLGDISTGASNDIERASHIARKMVTTYGMSEKLGSIAFESGHDEVFIGKTMGQTRSYSEKTAAEIDDEVKAIIDRAYARCEEILTARREVLTAVAEYLLAHETMTGEEFERMVGEKA